MLRSLRARLLLLTAAVVGVALVAVTMFSRVAVRHEFGELLMRDRGRGLAGAAEMLSEQARRPGVPGVTDSALARLTTMTGQDMVFVAPDGRVLAASTPALRSARITLSPSGEAVVAIEEVVRGVRTLRRAVLQGGPHAEVRGPEGVPLGFLLPFPRNLGAPGASEPAFLPAVNRWLLWAMLGAGALALLLTLALSRRILGPVEDLTHAARRMTEGDRSIRVTARSGDEIGELSRAFNAMAESLEQDERLRRALVSDVAHELRTPLTNLRCQIEAIQDGLSPANEAALHSLAEETALLGRLVEDLQELALAESGNLPLHREAVALAPAVEAALDAVRSQAAESGVALEADVPGALPAADADPGRLAQILRNLLANALTHTPRGGSIRVLGRQAAGAVTLTVADTGRGIEPEHLPHVFDRFYRADPSRARQSGGAGLGLAIVRQLAEAHGGQATAESVPGRGARFTVTLPIHPSS